jgi:hypothetical protein
MGANADPRQEDIREARSPMPGSFWVQMLDELAVVERGSASRRKRMQKLIIVDIVRKAMLSIRCFPGSSEL